MSTSYYNKPAEVKPITPDMKDRLDAFATAFAGEPTNATTVDSLGNIGRTFIKPKVLRAYIAGPMRARPQFNFPAFFAAEEQLKRAGYEVFNPARRDEDIGFTAEGLTGNEDLSLLGFDLREALAADTEFIAKHADVVVVLPEWETSSGARAEVALARALGLPVETIAGEAVEEAKPEPRHILPMTDHHAPINPNPKDVIGSGKVPMGLVSDLAIAEESLAKAEGAAKYGAYNYRATPVRASIYVDAAKRHIAKWHNGEDRDPKTKVHHLGSVRACFGIILDAEAHGTLIDDRPPANPRLSALLDGMSENVGHIRELFKGYSPKHYTIKDQ